MTDKIPSLLLFMYNKDDLTWVRLPSAIQEFRDKEGSSGIVFTESGFWATQDDIKKLKKQGIIPKEAKPKQVIK